MKNISLGIFLILFLNTILFGQITIDITNPKEDETLSETNLTVKATITKNGSQEWEGIKYKLDNKSWENYDITGLTSNDTIHFSQEFNDLKDDASHSITIRAKLNNADSTDITRHFNVSTPPEIKEDKLTPNKISPNNNKLKITLVFNKEMDTNTKPTFYFFKDDSPIDTLKNEGAWSTTADTFKVSTTDLVTKTGIDAKITIQASDAKSKFGTKMKKKTLNSSFQLDTQKPKVSQVEYSPDRPINSVPAEKLTLIIHFDEPMNTGVKPSVVLFNGSTEAVFSKSGKWEDNKTYSVKNDTTVGPGFPDAQKGTVRIEKAKDAGGNQMEKSEKYTAFLFDHSAPQLVRLKSSDQRVHVQNPGEITLRFYFNEKMNTNILPTVKIKSDTNQLVFGSNGKWLNKTSYEISNEVTIDSHFAADGQKVITLLENAKDLAGNLFKNSTIADTVAFVMDHKPPQLQDVKSNRLYVNHSTFKGIRLTLTFNEPVIAGDIEVKVQDSLSVDFEPINQDEKAATLVYESKSNLDQIVKDGSLSFTFSSYKDTVNNRYTGEKKFTNVLTVDTKAPAKPTIFPHDRSTNKNTFIFKGEKSDDNNHVGIKINGEEYVSKMDANNNWEYNLDISSYDDEGKVEGKLYEFRIRTIDAAGNESKDVIDSLVIDRTAPQKAEINPDPFKQKYINTNSVQFGLKNTSGEKARFVFTESSIQWDIPVKDENYYFAKGHSETNLVKTFAKNIDGERELKLFGIDTLGNRSNQPIKTWNFIIDRVAPRIDKVLVNGKPTTDEDLVYVGPSKPDQLNFTFLFIEETSGIDYTNPPTILLKGTDSKNKLEFSKEGTWNGKQYNISLNQDIPANYQYDGVYKIQLFNIKDKAENSSIDTTHYKLFIDTHAPQKPSISNYSSNSIVTNENIIELKGTKPEDEVTRILLKENGQILDSTEWSSNSDWEVNFLASESREYNISIVTQDLAYNISSAQEMIFTIDWVPPVLSAKMPYMQIENLNNIEIGHLILFFSEEIKEILRPASDLFVYQKENPEKKLIPTDLYIDQNQLIAEFSDVDISKLAHWINEQRTPLLNLPEGMVSDIAGNLNLEVDAIPFTIISPSIINEISKIQTFFSPNGDGIKDSLTLDINFADSKDKYLNITIYDPSEAGTVFSLHNQSISASTLPFGTPDSSCLIKKIGPNKIRFSWDGRSSVTNKLVPEGTYSLKISASVNPNFATQFPFIENVQVDTSAPQIRKIYPTIGQGDILTLNQNKTTILKLYPMDSIYAYILDSDNQLKPIDYLKASIEFGIVKDSIFNTLKIHRMKPDSVEKNKFFIFEMDSALIETLKKDSITSMKFVLTDSAKSGMSEYFLNVKIDSTRKVELTQLVNFPNPFNPETEYTTFQFNKGTNDPNVELRIFDVSGELVYLKKITNEGGKETYIQEKWNGTSLRGNKLANGVYFAIVTSGGKKSKVAKVLIFRK